MIAFTCNACNHVRTKGWHFSQGDYHICGECRDKGTMFPGQHRKPGPAPDEDNMTEHGRMGVMMGECDNSGKCVPSANDQDGQRDLYYGINYPKPQDV